MKNRPNIFLVMCSPLLVLGPCLSLVQNKHNSKIYNDGIPLLESTNNFLDKKWLDGKTNLIASHNEYVYTISNDNKLWLINTNNPDKIPLSIALPNPDQVTNIAVAGDKIFILDDKCIFVSKINLKTGLPTGFQSIDYTNYAFDWIFSKTDTNRVFFQTKSEENKAYFIHSFVLDNNLHPTNWKDIDLSQDPTLISCNESYFSSIDVDSQNNIYATGANTQRIFKIDDKLSKITTINMPYAWTDYKFSNIYIDSNDNIYTFFNKPDHHSGLLKNIINTKEKPIQRIYDKLGIYTNNGFEYDNKMWFIDCNQQSLWYEDGKGSLTHLTCEITDPSGSYFFDNGISAIDTNLYTHQQQLLPQMIFSIPDLESRFDEFMLEQYFDPSTIIPAKKLIPWTPIEPSFIPWSPLFIPLTPLFIPLTPLFIPWSPYQPSHINWIPINPQSKTIKNYYNYALTILIAGMSLLIFSLIFVSLLIFRLAWKKRGVK